MQTSLSAALPNSRLRPETVECPKCSKHSIVKRSPNTFDCLNCNFHKELPPVTSTLRSPTTPTIRSFPSYQQHSTYPRTRPTGLTRYPLPEPSGSLAEDDQARPLVFVAVVIILCILFL